MIRLNPDQRTVFLVGVVNSQIASTSSALVQQPQIGKGSRERGRDISNRTKSDVREQIVDDRNEKEGVRRQ